MANEGDVEKGYMRDWFSNWPRPDSDDNGPLLNRIRTAGSVSMTPELFEKLYLSPKNQVSGDIRTKFANPTPL